VQWYDECSFRFSSMGKSWYQSKTFWFNGLTVLLVVATFFGFEQNVELAETTRGILISVAPIINIVLRLVTSEPIV